MFCTYIGTIVQYCCAEFERDASVSVFTAAVYISRPQVCSAIFTMEKAAGEFVLNSVFLMKF